MINPEPCPPMDSLGDWNVGAEPDGTIQVRFELTDKEEARAWAVWLMNKGDKSDE
jgi:hypothetical protein